MSRVLLTSHHRRLCDPARLLSLMRYSILYRMRGSRQKKSVSGKFARIVLADALREAARKGTLNRLLEGLLTTDERDVLAQRVFVARLLRAGWSYRKIRAWTGASPNTIATVDRWLKHKNPHYRRQVPLPQRRERRDRAGGFSDTFHPLPGSMKDLYRSLTGTWLW